MNAQNDLIDYIGENVIHYEEGEDPETDDVYTVDEVDALLLTKQDVLVSGTNIKTINGNNILGSGNVNIESGRVDDVTVDGTSVVTNKIASISLSGKQDVISDLATIRSGAALGATALQSFTETDPTVPA